MSRPELATYVHVADEHDQMHVFGPDSPPPAWAVPKIVNPKAWVGGTVPAPSRVESPEQELVRLQARINALKAAVGDGGAYAPPAAAGPPPKKGPGSGAPSWREYAASKGVEVAPDATRDDVIAALDAARVPTE